MHPPQISQSWVKFRVPCEISQIPAFYLRCLNLNHSDYNHHLDLVCRLGLILRNVVSLRAWNCSRKPAKTTNMCTRFPPCQAINQWEAKSSIQQYSPKIYRAFGEWMELWIFLWGRGSLRILWCLGAPVVLDTCVWHWMKVAWFYRISRLWNGK